MELEKVINLSLLEGLTEFIPVSSTGHLILLGSYFGDGGEAEKLFDVFIQLGAILAVVALYYKKIWHLFLDLIGRRQGTEGKAYSPYAIVIACLPPLILGFLFYKQIKSLLFYPKPVAIALIVGGIGLILVEKLKTESEMVSSSSQLSLKQALIVGLFQSLSLWPGMSRSGSCLIGARLAGVGRVLAAEFSFLVAIPIMFVAVAYDVLKNIDLFLSSELRMFTLGFVIAFVSGALAIKLFISYLSRFSLIPFGVYRIILGIFVLYPY